MPGYFHLLADTDRHCCCFLLMDKDDMTLLELYEKLSTGEMKLRTGLCMLLYENDLAGYAELSDLFSIHGYVSTSGVMTAERETLLLLFAAYKGEL